MESQILENTTIAELVANDYRTAEIFKKHKIDFCCGGKKSMAKACAEKNIDPQQLEEEILSLQNKTNQPAHNFNEWGLGFLADYIQQVHHTYVNNNLNLISEFADKVARVHGEHAPETKEIAGLWREVVAELTMHMKKEELLLFPYIKNLERFSKGEISHLPSSHFRTIKNPISMMEQEHDLAGSLMKSIAVLSNDFTPPAHACNTYIVLYAKLKEFQDDLFQHIHLENNILFPKAILLEDAFSSSGNSCSL
jgi:regulator of cell morphogenesis and NO signaling